MYKEIIDLLICPECREDLELIDGREFCGEIVSGKLACSNGHHWNIREGILDFISREQEIINRLFETLICENFKERGGKTRYKNPESLKRTASKTFSKVVIYTNKTDSKHIIDSSDKVSPLKKFVSEAPPDTQIISTNLSYAVLKSNRAELKRLNKDAKVNYIACDAAKLPFKDNSIDMAVSYERHNTEGDN